MTLLLPDEIGSAAIQTALELLTTVTDVVGQRMFNAGFIPQDARYPALLHYSEPGGLGFDDFVSSSSLFATYTMRYVILISCEGESTEQIAPASLAVIQRFKKGYVPCEPGYSVFTKLLDLWPQLLGTGTIEQGGVIYRQMGSFYEVQVNNQGV